MRPFKVFIIVSAVVTVHETVAKRKNRRAFILYQWTALNSTKQLSQWQTPVGFRSSTRPT
jgi:hypothetical protein